MGREGTDDPAGNVRAHGDEDVKCVDGGRGGRGREGRVCGVAVSAVRSPQSVGYLGLAAGPTSLRIEPCVPLAGWLLSLGLVEEVSTGSPTPLRWPTHRRLDLTYPRPRNQWSGSGGQ